MKNKAYIGSKNFKHWSIDSYLYIVTYVQTYKFNEILLEFEKKY